MDEKERYYLYEIGYNLMKGYDKQVTFWESRSISIGKSKPGEDDYEMIQDLFLDNAWKIICFAFGLDYEVMIEKDEFWKLMGKTNFRDESAKDGYEKFKEKILSIK